MKRLFGLALAMGMMLGVSSVSAADFGGYGVVEKDDWIVRPNWSGFYVGVIGGYGDANWSANVAHPCPECLPKQFQADAFAGSGSLDSNGWLAGAQVGAAKQFGNWVLGVEADIAWTTIDGDHTFRMDYDTDWRVRSEIDMLGTGRVKVGYAFGNLLFYGTGGVAWGVIDTDMQTVSITGPVVMSNLSSRTHHVGWTLGGGVEWALTDYLSLKGEYLYMDLGTKDHDPKGLAYAGTPMQFNHHELMSEDLELHTFRLGLSYKFGG